MTKGHFQTLIDAIQSAGYVDADGNHLADAREWHALVQVLQKHPGWPGGYGGKLSDHTAQMLNAPPTGMLPLPDWADRDLIDKQGTLELGVPWAVPPSDLPRWGCNGGLRMPDDYWETMESAPLDGREVEVRIRTGETYHARYVDDGSFWQRAGQYQHPIYPTHWRPLA